MATLSLAVPARPHNPTPLLYQDTHALAALFLVSYQYHLDRPLPETTEFIQKTKQLVALGYKLTHQSTHRRLIYNRYRQQFLHYDEGDFRKHLLLLDTWVESLAKMVQYAIQSELELPYHDHYETFLELLESVLNPAKMVSLRQQTTAYQLIEELKRLG